MPANLGEGSYYLVEDIVTAGAGITVGNNATIDLMGFKLVGGTGPGIKGGQGGNVEIRNGTVSGWSRHGIEMRGPNNCSSSIRVSE